MDYLSFILCLLLAWAAIYLLISATQKDDQSHPRKLPPGPHSFPVIGHLPSLAKNPHTTLAELAKTYGPLIMVHLGQIPTVVISSATMANEILQNNDSSVSSRTVIDAVRAHNHHERSLIWLPDGPKWYTLSKISTTKIFSAASLDDSQSLRSNIVNDLISYLKKSSEDGRVVDIGQLASNTTMNLLSTTLFSLDLNDPSNSENAHVVQESIRGIMDLSGKPNLSDYFPMLRKMDPLQIRRKIGVHFGKMIDLFNTTINQRLEGKRLTSSVQCNDALDSLLSTTGNEDQIAQSDIPHLLRDLLSAGADSTSTTLVWAMAELLHNPEKLRKAKGELQKVIGIKNQIRESDINRLPYLNAVIKETLRLHPSVPLSIPRKADTDLKVFGFTVPKNAQILVNIWAIGRDPDVWDRPDEFDPDRFIGLGSGRDYEVIAFGSGRRACPGRVMAVRMLHLMLGSLIHGFEWEVEGGVS
ncbi:geraniol 8-hydroxylase-like [Silene latifolia]|uniref:geraniol 8-hydroxylase-like n=1 Tax=Silene latifolia TaxID=37657 RepID=UPI003D77A2AD